jgi:hypothetical protein
MKVYQTNFEGFFMMELEADKDPIDTNNWLIPGGCVTKKPEIRENYSAKWDGSKWIYIKNEIKTDNVRANLPPDLATIRKTFSVSRAYFCNALADFEILTDEESISSALGNWPESFKGFLDYLNPRQKRDAQITWAAAATVERMHEFVLLLAWWKNISEEDLDKIFGIDLYVGEQ